MSDNVFSQGESEERYEALLERYQKLQEQHQKLSNLVTDLNERLNRLPFLHLEALEDVELEDLADIHTIDDFVSSLCLELDSKKNLFTIENENQGEQI